MTYPAPMRGRRPFLGGGHEWSIFHNQDLGILGSFFLPDMSLTKFRQGREILPDTLPQSKPRHRWSRRRRASRNQCSVQRKLTKT